MSVSSNDTEILSDHGSEVSESTSGLSHQTVVEQSKIYGKGRGDNLKLTNRQKEVNLAALVICLQNNEMLDDRAALKLDAEKKARKTYVFLKKRGSRSAFDDKPPLPKKSRISGDEREKQIANVSQRLRKQSNI